MNKVEQRKTLKPPEKIFEDLCKKKKIEEYKLFWKYKFGPLFTSLQLSVAILLVLCHSHWVKYLLKDVEEKGKFAK